METERVLVVDDDEGLLFLVTKALERNGFQVVGASNGLEALQTLRSAEPFAVLLTDLMMPGLNGLDLSKEARLLDNHIEVVFMTAAATLETAISALRGGGAYDYLLKPFESMAGLSVTIERAANHRRLILEREELLARVKSEVERLQALIDNTGDAILSANAEGILTIANPVALRLLNKDGLVGSPVFSNLPLELAMFVNNWQTAGSHGNAVREIPWPDYSTQMASLTPVTGNDGSRDGWIMVIRDITHLKQLDELKTQALSNLANKIQLPLAQAMNALTELNVLATQDQRVAESVYRFSKVWERVQEWGDELSNLARIDAELQVQPAFVNPPNSEMRC